MTKVYILSSGSDDDYEVHGIYSRYWKAYKGLLILEAVEDNLHIDTYKLDELENIYPDVQSGRHYYRLYAPKYSTIVTPNKKQWNVHKCGIDSYTYTSPYLGEEYVDGSGHAYYARVRASSEVEAIEKAEGLLKEKEGEY